MKFFIISAVTFLSMSVVTADDYVATLNPTGGNIARGIVTVDDTNKGVVISAVINGLVPGGLYSLDFHQFGDVTAPLLGSAGNHINPLGRSGVSIVADDAGVATLRTRVPKSFFPNGSSAVPGRAVALFQKPTDPTAEISLVSVGVVGFRNPAIDSFGSMEDFPGRERYVAVVQAEPKPLEEAGEVIEDVAEEVAEGIGEAAEDTGRALRNIGRAIESELSN